MFLKPVYYYYFFPDMEVIATATCSHQPKAVNICGSKSRFRKKAHHQSRTPYDQSACSPNQPRSKVKLQDNKETPSENYKVFPVFHRFRLSRFFFFELF